MTVIPFPHRVTDELRLAILGACEDGDFKMARHLLAVLRKHVASPAHLPAALDHWQPERDERLVNLWAANDA